MRFITTRSFADRQTPGVSFGFALFEGLAPDGGLYVPESIPQWSAREIERLTSGQGMSLAEVGAAGEDAMLPALDEALTRLEAIDPEQARIIELRFFGGLSIEDAAAALDISPATLKRRWSLARAWLFRELTSRLT